MARLIRPLMQLPHLHNHSCFRVTPDRILLFSYLLLPPLPVSGKTISHLLSYTTTTSDSPPRLRRNHHRRSRGLGTPNALVPTVLREENNNDGDGSSSSGEEESDAKKSRNQRKREARRAVRWGMELATFSNSQIKRVLGAASLDEDVFDALMLAKRLGPDVREGKRRHFNYIGKLLREVEPDLMDTLIYAIKHGDQRTLQALGGVTKSNREDGDDDSNVESDTENEAERSEEYISMATRWFDGLISKNVEVTNEVYSLQSVDFDRQELRKLVRRVQSAQEQCRNIAQETEEDINKAVMNAEKSLSRFLHSLAKQMPREQLGSF